MHSLDKSLPALTEKGNIVGVIGDPNSGNRFFQNFWKNRELLLVLISGVMTAITRPQRLIGIGICLKKVMKPLDVIYAYRTSASGFLVQKKTNHHRRFFVQEYRYHQVFLRFLHGKNLQLFYRLIRLYQKRHEKQNV